jgi:hypothetical protein
MRIKIDIKIKDECCAIRFPDSIEALKDAHGIQLRIC